MGSRASGRNKGIYYRIYEYIYIYIYIYKV